MKNVEGDFHRSYKSFGNSFLSRQDSAENAIFALAGLEPVHSRSLYQDCTSVRELMREIVANDPTCIPEIHNHTETPVALLKNRPSLILSAFIWYMITTTIKPEFHLYPSPLLVL